MTEAEMMVSGYGGPLRPSVVEIAENALCIERALRRARPAMESQPVHVVEVVGVHPHEVTRENKAWVGFRNLARTHAALVTLIDEITGASAADDGEDPLLAIVEEMRSA